MKKITTFVVLVLLSILDTAVYSQSIDFPTKGYPFSVSYTRGVDYFGSLQTWGIVRDKKGILFFGNSNFGIQQFDGTHWRNISTPGSSQALSFDLDESGNVYAGTNTAFGRIDFNETSSYTFTSLLPLLPDSLGIVTDIHHTVSLGSYIYFVSSNVGYQYHPKSETISVFHTESRFRDVIEADNKVWMFENERGLFFFDKNGHRSDIQNPPFANSILSVFNLSNQLAVITTDGALWVFSENEWYQQKTLPGFEDGKISGIGDVITLHDGSIAVASLSGVYIFDEKGGLTYHFTEENILSGTLSHRLFQDDEGILWVTGHNGITGIEIARPMREFLPNQGAPDSGIRTVTEFNNDVFVATESGFFKSEGDSFKVALENKVIYDFLEIPAGLIIASTDGLHLYDENGELSLIYSDNRINKLSGSLLNEHLFYAARFREGLFAGVLQPNQQLKMQLLFPYDNSMFTIDEDRHGDIWMGTGRNGILQLHTNRNSGEIPQVESHRLYTTEDGLPADGFNYTKRALDDVGFITEDGFYRLTANRDSIIKDNRYASFFGDEGGFRVWPVTPGRDGSGSNWIARAAWKIGKATYNPETEVFDWYEYEYTRMAVYRNVTTIHDAESGRVYFQAFNRVGYFDERIPHKPLPDFRAHITQVTANDSIVYTGWGRVINNERYTHTFDNNNLRFNFGLISFLPADRNAYQYYLEGADKNWSDWNDELYADYRNLREGTYTFHVRGRNLYYIPSEMASFTFTILPPWYRSLWAYLGYGLFFIGIVFGFSKWRTQQLMVRQAELETQVEERTEEVRKKSEQLEKLDKIKSTFFSNVSHEFRTPLTLIKGPAEQLIAEKNLSTPDRIRQYERILENSNRLLSLIDQILNLSKMESGTYILQLRRIDLNALISKISGWYAEIAKRKGLELKLHLSAEPFWVYADVEQIELLFSNIISNAVKYTEKGSISVSCLINKDSAEISVKDTGIGIPAEDQERVFDRYFRAKSGLLSTSGSGIGLNLVKYVAELHGLEINLESEEGNGTEITIQYQSGLATVKADYVILEDDESIPKMYQAGETHAPIAPQTNLDFVNDDTEHSSMIDESEDIPLLLLADDNHDIRAFIRSVLGDAYRYAECADGHQLVAMAKSLQPDVILSDVMMPGLDGISASRMIKSDPETGHIPIIMITAKGGNQNELTGLESGANDYITKPFSPAILQARVSGQISLLMRLRNYYRQELKSQNPDSDTLTEQNNTIPDWQLKIDAELHNPDFSVQDMSATLAMSSSSLNRFIKKEAGCSPQEYIRKRRIEQACIYIEDQKGTISEIAYSVGFNSVNYFCRVFRQFKGVSPTQFQEGV